MEQFALENVRFKIPLDNRESWEAINPIIYPGELILIQLGENKVRVKVGIGKGFNDTPYPYEVDRYNSAYRDSPTAEDENIKPEGSTGHNTEDFIHIYGDIIYPINLTTSVKLADGTNLQSWMDNVKTGNLVLRGDLKVLRSIDGVDCEEVSVIKVVADAASGHDIAISAGGNTILGSGEAPTALLPTPAGGEHLYLASDDRIYFYTGLQGGISTRYTLNNEGFVPLQDNAKRLGDETHMWNSIFVNNAYINHALLKNNSTNEFKGIQGNTGNDFWRIGGALLDASDVDTGYLEIATGDNGNEPIYIRQYSGETALRTLTLLTPEGNTILPKALTIGSHLYLAEHTNIYFTASAGPSTAQSLMFKNNDDTTYGGVGYYCNDGVGQRIYMGISSAPWDLENSLSITATDITFLNNKVWHAGNDGSNSGLDADTLDGKHASAFALVDHTHEDGGGGDVVQSGPPDKLLFNSNAVNLLDGPEARLNNLFVYLIDGGYVNLEEGVQFDYTHPILYLEEIEPENGGPNFNAYTTHPALPISILPLDSSIAPEDLTAGTPLYFEGHIVFDATFCFGGECVTTRLRNPYPPTRGQAAPPEYLLLGYCTSSTEFTLATERSIITNGVNIAGAYPSNNMYGEVVPMATMSNGTINIFDNRTGYGAKDLEKVTTTTISLDCIPLPDFTDGSKYINNRIYVYNTELGVYIELKVGIEFDMTRPIVFLSTDISPSSRTINTEEVDYFNSAYISYPYTYLGGISVYDDSPAAPIYIECNFTELYNRISVVRFVRGLPPNHGSSTDIYCYILLGYTAGSNITLVQDHPMFVDTGQMLPEQESDGLYMPSIYISAFSRAAMQASNTHQFEGRTYGQFVVELQTNHSHGSLLLELDTFDNNCILGRSDFANPNVVYDRLVPGGKFDTSYPIAYRKHEIYAYHTNVPINSIFEYSGTTGQPLYLKGISSNEYFTIDATSPLTCYPKADITDPPYTRYLLLGYCNDDTSFTLIQDHPMLVRCEDYNSTNKNFFSSVPLSITSLSTINSLNIKTDTETIEFNGSNQATLDLRGLPTNVILKDITIASAGWNSSNNTYTITSDRILESHVPQVFFARESLDAASKAGITTVYTENGRCILECKTLPTVALVIETLICTPV